MQWLVVSCLAVLASGCNLDTYDNGYQVPRQRVHVHPSRDYYYGPRNNYSRHYYYGYRNNRNNPNVVQHVEVPAAPARNLGNQPQPGASNYHGHDDSQHGGNQHGHDVVVPGYSNAVPSGQDPTIHGHG